MIPIEISFLISVAALVLGFIVCHFQKKKQIVVLEKEKLVLSDQCAHIVHVPENIRRLNQDKWHVWFKLKGVEHAVTEEMIRDAIKRAENLRAQGVRP